ncbi:hypothetical protein Tco_1032141 [Tanacetum coccineum]|uniref:Zinc finger, CCHC-type n=1 Tax=Tanacetum coccineum TaxID=301880 RepID=A0ABQ5GCH0_9ASTR
MEADRLLALRLQEEEREQTAAIRNRPPTRTQLRSQMMTYLKHVGNKKHSDLKNKSFEEIQALYEKVKRFDESFTVIGSNEDERKIKEINERASDPNNNKKFIKEDVLTKVPAELDVAEQGTKKRKGGHMKMLARKRKRPQPDVDSDDEHRKCLKILEDGTVIHMLVERRYPLSKDLLQRMLDFGLEVEMTTSVRNNSVFRSFFEKQKLIGPNFIDWYRQLRLVLSTEDKENYLKYPILEAPVAPSGHQVPPAAAAAHAAWVKGQKEVVVVGKYIIKYLLVV